MVTVQTVRRFLYGTFGVLVKIPPGWCIKQKCQLTEAMDMSIKHQRPWFLFSKYSTRLHQIYYMLLIYYPGHAPLLKKTGGHVRINPENMLAKI